MKKCTFIKVYQVAKNQSGQLINSYIYATDSHALALHQLEKDYPCFSRADIVCEARTIDIDAEENKELYQAHKECGCYETKCSWN